MFSIFTRTWRTWLGESNSSSLVNKDKTWMGSKEMYLRSFGDKPGPGFLEGIDNSFIPHVTGISREQYVLIGRISFYGYVTAGIFPVFLNKAFMQALLCGDDPY